MPTLPTGRRALVAVTIACCLASTPALPADLEKIETIVVIFLENRSFDHLYGHFPGANGLDNASSEALRQRDRDGTILPELPPIWKGLTPKGSTPMIDAAATRDLPNAPFTIDDPRGFDLPLGKGTTDVQHRFYQNQMQINGGRNDRFVAYSDAGALTMGHYDGTKLPLWPIAERYTLADNFFMGAFGGSFLNHIYLICACVPRYLDADKSPAKGLIAAVDAAGASLKLAEDSPKSALDGVPRYANDGALTPDFYAVNTMQPPYQPSAIGPAPGGDKAFADPHASRTLPPQTETTIGDLLSAKGISWAWYAGAWAAALEHVSVEPDPRFQYHHQPFNYFAAYAPGTEARATHLEDAGIDGARLVTAIDAGNLPQVTFYEPQGSLTEHSGYTDILTGDRHVADLVSHLERSPQWPHMLVVVAYDENGGFWDHAAPPKGDRWGPGTRIPTLIISPYAKKGHVDHTLYDTGSILRFITRRFDLPELLGITLRDDAMAASGNKPGDLTPALELGEREP